MADHQRMLNRAQAKRKAATYLRKTIEPKYQHNIPGGPWTPGYDVTKWR